MRIESIEIKIATGIWEELAAEFLLEELLGTGQAVLARSVAVLVVPESHVYASVGTIIVLPSSLPRKLLEIRNILELIN